MKVFKTILKVLLIIFIVMITITAGVVGAVVYRNWARSQNEIIDSEGNITVKDNVSFIVDIIDDFKGKVNVTVEGNLIYTGDVKSLISVLNNFTEIIFFENLNL